MSNGVGVPSSRSLATASREALFILRNSHVGHGPAVAALCEPVPPPQETLQFQQYFCAEEPGNAEQIKANEPKRVDLYKAVTAVTRAYANIANDLRAAGYTEDQAESIRAEINKYAALRDEVKIGAGENVDFKQFEAGMRSLLDTYIQADASKVAATFEDKGLIQLIAELGAGRSSSCRQASRTGPRPSPKRSPTYMRRVIIDERAMNPKYYDSMSELLDALIEEQRKEAIEYEEYLRKLIEACSIAIAPKPTAPLHFSINVTVPP